MTVATILSIRNGMEVPDREAGLIGPGGFRPRYRRVVALSGKHKPIRLTTAFRHIGRQQTTYLTVGVARR